MYKICIFLFIAGLYCSSSFAEEITVGQHILESKTFEGRIASIILPDPANGIKHEIVVGGDNGRMKFLLASGIGVYGPDWQVLNLKKIKPGDNVSVEYTTTKAGVNRAISITVE